MKNLIAIILFTVIAFGSNAQKLPKDIQKVYDQAEKYENKGDFKQAVATYKDVLRSVDHVPTMIQIGDLQMRRAQPHYREAYEYYQMAITSLDHGIATADKNSVKKRMVKLRDETTPKRNKAKSYVDDFDKAKELKQGGSRLLDDPDLK